jgi:transaldolase
VPTPHDLTQLGQAVWLDFIQRSFLRDAGLSRLVDEGVRGVTSNPTIFQKAIGESDDYDQQLREVARDASTEQAYEALAIADIARACDELRPTYDRLDGRDGFVSLEVSPALAHDTRGTVAAARRLAAAVGRPNLMIKVPGTPAGVPAIAELIGAGININVTLLFSVDGYRSVAAAYLDGLTTLAAHGPTVPGGHAVNRIGSVASFFVSRVDTAVDGLLSEDSAELMGRAAIANARMAYRNFREAFGGERFDALRARGARVQRPLWASTSTKNPAYSDLLYIDNLIGPDTVNTMPPPTLTAFIDHGDVRRTIDQDDAGAEQTLASLEAAGVSMDAVTDKLLADGVKAFADSFELLLANVEAKRALLLERTTAETVR